MASPPPVKNISSWKLNKEEKATVAERVAAGEDELTVTRELQQRKAEASRDRKLAAEAVATRSAQNQQQKAAKAKAAPKPSEAAFESADVQEDATNKGYYEAVQVDGEIILKEYGKDFQKEAPLSIAAAANSGVQDCYDKEKAAHAMAVHGVYRCSVSIWWLNLLSSATPSIPMSRKRVEDLCEFSYGPSGEAKFHTDRMVEVAISRGELQTDTPCSLQVISPEEILHATLAGTRESLDADSWKEKREKWRCILLSIPCSFVEVPKSEYWWRSFNKRQAIQQEHESLSRTALQYSMEIFAMKNVVEAQAGKKLSTQALAAQLLQLGLQPVVAGSKASTPGHDEEESGAGCLSSNFINAALNCHKWILGSGPLVEMLMELEANYGSKSPFHKMTMLNCLAMKATSAKSRQWVLATVCDLIAHGQMKCSDVTKSSLSGDKHHTGLVALYELKARELVYGKQHDHTLKQAAKQGAVEAVLEHENVQEKWKKVEAQLANEAAEREAKLKGAKSDESSEPEEETVVIRKSPNAFALHSPAYWRAVANATVRTYISLSQEPKTLDALSSAIAQSNLKNIKGNAGENSVITMLDVDCLGESMGPACQHALRKQFQAPQALLSKLIHGSMLGRGSQKVTEAGECTAVIEGDLLMIHVGMNRSKKEIKGLFTVGNGKQNRSDADLKDSIILFTDESLRSRKKRVKGSYSGHSHLVTASSANLSQAVPEKTYDYHAGSCWSDVVTNVEALSGSELTDKEEILGQNRIVEVTADAKEKAEGGEGAATLESVFSAAILPEKFYRDLLRGHSAKGMIDLAAGQGTACKACLAERLPYFGLTLTETHSKKLELQLTDFVVAEMKREGSTFFRPEACQNPAEEEEKKPPPKSKGSKRTKADESANPNPPKKNKKEEAGETAGGDEEKPSKKKKKTEKADEEDEGSEGESLPW
eukprot:s89_g15.t1